MARTPTVVPFPQGRTITEQGVMRIFADAHKDHYRYNHDAKKWLVWREHRWREDGKQRVVEIVMGLCRSLGGGSTLNKVRFAEAVERGARAQREFATAGPEWDADPWLLGTPDGVVDLRSGELRPGQPDDMISKATLVAPAPLAACPRWIDFLDEALQGDGDAIDFFQRFCGYTLTGLVSEEMLLFIAGRSGTGKGTATKTILSILKDYAMTVPMAMFMGNPGHSAEYYRAQLQGRRLVLSSEPEKGATWSDAFVNELTGGDQLSGRNPTGRPFMFDPTFKLWFNGEQMPNLKSVATGLRRRLGLLLFDHQPLNPDHNLKSTLKAESSGILRWCIDGALEWQRIGLAPPECVTAAVDDYFERQDTLGMWIAECCDLASTFRTKPIVLLISYNNWADQNNEKRLSSRDFAQAMRKRFDQTTIHGTNYMHGIAIKPEPIRGSEYTDDDM